MRETRRCWSCREARVGLLESLPDATSGEVSYRALGAIIGELQALQVTRKHGEEKRSIETFAKGKPIKSGSIEAVVCTHCGCVDLYAQDPQWTPFRKLRAFRASDHPSTDDPSIEESEMWPGRRCPRCTSEETGKLSKLPDTVGKETQVREQAIGVDAQGEPRGRLEALVCTNCGFMQLVVADPKSVDFQSLEGFCWLTPDGGPYR